MKCIDSVNVGRKTVIIRCDLNVSISDGKIIDDTRIKKSVRTIKYVIDNGGKAVIISHLGRIKTDADKSKYSLSIVFNTLNKYLDGKLKFVKDLDFNVIKGKIVACPFGNAVLLENARFYDLNGNLESDCSLELAKKYAMLGNIFVNDAFGTIHRKHASNYGISKYMPSYCGFLLLDEIHNLDILDNPKRPFAVIIGGSKVSDKITILKSLLKKVDKIFIGGAMAFTFLKASNISTGNSLVEYEMLDACKKLLIKYKEKIMLPIDLVGSSSFKDVSGKCFYITDIPSNFIGMDIGPMTLEMIKNDFVDVECVFMNGPVGVYEFENYKNGTIELLKYISNIDTSIIGGGDVVSCASSCLLLDKFSFVSTGGGATLSYIESKKQPGLVNLK